MPITRCTLVHGDRALYSCEVCCVIEPLFSRISWYLQILNSFRLVLILYTFFLELKKVTSVQYSADFVHVLSDITSKIFSCFLFQLMILNNIWNKICRIYQHTKFKCLFAAIHKLLPRKREAKYSFHVFVVRLFWYIDSGLSLYKVTPNSHVRASAIDFRKLRSCGGLQFNNVHQYPTSGSRVTDRRTDTISLACSVSFTSCETNGRSPALGRRLRVPLSFHVVSSAPEQHIAFVWRWRHSPKDHVRHFHSRKSCCKLQWVSEFLQKGNYASSVTKLNNIMCTRKIQVFGWTEVIFVLKLKPCDQPYELAIDLIAQLPPMKYSLMIIVYSVINHNVLIRLGMSTEFAERYKVVG